MPLNTVTAYEVVEIQLHLFLTSVLGGVVLTSHLRRFTLWKETSLPIEQEAANCNQWPIWKNTCCQTPWLLGGWRENDTSWTPCFRVLWLYRKGLERKRASFLQNVPSNIAENVAKIWKSRFHSVYLTCSKHKRVHRPFASKNVISATVETRLFWSLSYMLNCKNNICLYKSLIKLKEFTTEIWRQSGC